MNFPPNLFQSYSTFYLIAITLTGLVLLFNLKKNQKEDLVPQLMLICTYVLFGILGSKLFPLALAEYPDFFIKGALNPVTTKSSIGAILGILIGANLMRFLLGYKEAFPRIFALCWPLTLLIPLRYGCYWAGCCFGSICGQPWAISYPADSWAARMHVQVGLIGSSSFGSLAIHPVQLYEILGALLIFGILFKLKDRFEKSNNLLYFSLFLYGCVRFCTEFFRYGEVLFLGLKPIQIGLLLVLPFIAVYIWYSERQNQKSYASFTNTKQFQAELLGLSFLGGLLYFCAHRFSPLEVMAIQLSILPVAYFSALYFINNFKKYPLSKSALALPILCIFFFAQKPMDKEDKLSSELEDAYYTFSGGGGIGSYESCGGDHPFGMGGVGVSRTQHLRTKTPLAIRYGVGVSGGVVKNHGARNTKFGIINFNPHGSLISKKYGSLKLGFHTGRLYVDESGVNVLPQLGLRLGYMKYLFLETHINNLPYSSPPVPILRVGIGSNFGLDSGLNCSIGVGDTGFYLHPNIPVNRNLHIEPFFSYGNSNVYQLNLNLKYRLY